MNILFYHPASGSDGYPEPPLGLGYLMSAARSHGARYGFYDEEHHSKFTTWERLSALCPPDLIAISFMTPQYDAAQQAIKAFKTRWPNARIIAGGAHPSCRPIETMGELADIDFLCAGEGEQTFADFLREFDGDSNWRSVQGLFYREGTEVHRNPARALAAAAELDGFSVDWSTLLSQGPYICKISYLDETGPVFPIITARGCPFDCTFCADRTIWQRRVRMRGIAGVMEEVRRLVCDHKAKRFNILDDTFTLAPERVFQFCRMAQPLDIRFRITARTTQVDLPMLQALKKAGCELVAYGVESGDDQVLAVMRKRQTTEDIRRAFQLTRQAGLLSYALCMVGNFGEDEGSAAKTASLLAELKPDFSSCSIMTPYPGTENFDIAQRNGWIRDIDWRHWVPSLLKTAGTLPLTRTDKMTAEQILRSYYSLSRRILVNRFRAKYGGWFFLRPAFLFHEVLSRIRSIGIAAFLRHAFGLWKGGGPRHASASSASSQQAARCPFCVSPGTASARFGLSSCRTCGMVWNESIRDPEANLKAESRWFSQEAFQPSPWVTLFELANSRRAWRAVSRLKPGAGRLLEIGVGRGTLLQYFRDKGYSVSGCDLSPAACEGVLQRHGISVQNAALEELPTDRRYDIIVMNHVLEHANDPARMLAAVRERTHPGGIAHIAVPNISCWSAALPGWPGYAPYHLSYFNPRTLAGLVRSAGFEVAASWTHESFSGWLLTALRTVLSSYAETASESSSAPSPRSGWKEHAYRAALVAFGIMSWPLRCLQAWLGRGDELVLIARNPPQ
jgi:radical SAM superfamily enzyme YgiQ (UPF0313 family)/SAM-dependent methyltransferase